MDVKFEKKRVEWKWNSHFFLLSFHPHKIKTKEIFEIPSYFFVIFWCIYENKRERAWDGRCNESSSKKMKERDEVKDSQVVREESHELLSCRVVK